jgi:O-antigen ligase
VTALVGLGAFLDEREPHSFAIVHGHVVARISGALEGPNQFAGFLDLMLPVLAAALIGSPSLGAAIERIGVTFAIAIGGVADVLTLSRAGIVAAILGCLSVLTRSLSQLRSPRMQRALGLVVFCVAATVVASGSASRFLDVGTSDHARETGLGNRAELWHAAVDLWRTSPVLGIGPGNYELELPRAGVTDAQTHANSLPLQTLAEQGLIGELLLVAVVSVQLLLFFRYSTKEPLVLGAFAATIAFYAHQLVDDLVFYPKVGLEASVIFGLAAGFIAAQEHSDKCYTPSLPD